MARNPNKRTYNRIINKSILLFNRHGILNTSVLKIAESLGISPGNITYHFKKKNDIIHAILDRLDGELVKTLSSAEEFGSKLDPREHYNLLMMLHSTLWKYRFVFNNIVFLNREDKKFGERFNEMQAHVISTLHGLFLLSIERGWLKPIKAPNTPQLIAENMWFLWLSWLRQSQLEGGRSNSSKNALYTSNLHLYSLISPYWNSKITDNLFQYLKEELTPAR